MSQGIEEVRRRIQVMKDAQSTELDLSLILRSITNRKEMDKVGDELGQLKNLTSLNLRGNNLTTLPDWFANLTNLTSLNLGGNNLTTLPDWFANLTNLTSLDLGYNKLTTLPDWFANLTNLTSLDLGYTGLTTLPDWFANFTNLTSLNLRGNNLTTLPDWFANFTNLTSLDLWNTGLTTLPDWFANLTNLTSLNLWDNKLTTLPDWFANLTNLTSLDLGYTGLTTLPDWFANFTNLTSLDLSGNNLTTLPDWFANFTNLTSLDLWNTGLTTLPDWFANLTNLTSLNLWDNKLTTLPDWFANFTNLTLLNLSGNKLTTLPDWFANLTNLTSLNLGYTGLTTLPDWFANFTNLTSLDLWDNKLTTLPDWFANLTNLTSLNLGYTGLTTLPDWFANFTNLTSLNLGYTGLTTLPDWFANFTNLTSLDLWDNKLTTLPDWFANLTNLTSLNLNGNKIEEPPLEIVSQGIESIRNYFLQRREQGEDLIYEAKLLIVGEGGSGKTSLAKKIKDENYILKKEGEADPEKSTEGIEVIQWRFPFENGKDFRVNIWDFGGQEIYKATHQFFLTKSSLYFLVTDDRKQDTNYYYWLKVVELLSDNSPLLIIKNEKQDRICHINELQLRGEFSNLEKSVATNLETNRGLNDIRDQLQHYISHLPHVKKPLPKGWVKVREVLEHDERNYLSLEDYLKICQPYGFTRREDKLQLSSYLHILGVCLHFQDDELLNQTVILKPKWGTDAVYRVLDNKRVVENSGRFTKDDLKAIWHEPQYENKRAELLQLMMRFKLCYQVPHKDLYIAPQLLPVNQPEFDWDETDNLILRYDYDFMPEGIITQFIVAMHEKIVGQQLVWHSGVVIENDDTQAKVIEQYHQGKKGIKINVRGKHQKETLAIVGYELEKIHATFTRLRYRQWVPCNCSVCKEHTEPHSYNYKSLRKFVALGRDEIPCEESGEPVSVVGLIEDVTDKRSYLMKEERYPKGEHQNFLPLFASQTNIETAYFQNAESGDFIQPRKVERIQTNRRDTLQPEKGDIIMPPEKETKIKSAWANGSFFLFLFLVVITGLAVLARSVSPYVLPGILIAAIIFVPIIGALQLRQDDRLSEKSFIELMKLSIGQLPLIGNFFNRDKHKG